MNTLYPVPALAEPYITSMLDHCVRRGGEARESEMAVMPYLPTKLLGGNYSRRGNNLMATLWEALMRRLDMPSVVLPSFNFTRQARRGRAVEP